MVIRGKVPTATLPQRGPTSHSSSSLRISLTLLKNSDDSLLTMSHFALGLKYRTWFFSTVFVLGGLGIPILPLITQLCFFDRVYLIVGEMIGYIGRTGSAFDVTLNNYFIMQICCLIISPAFFSAGLYLTIGNLYAPSLPLRFPLLIKFGIVLN